MEEKKKEEEINPVRDYRGKKETQREQISNGVNLREIRQRLEECQKQKDEYLNGWQRERADFLNYKKEEIGRIETIFKYANEGLILKILPILDNFDLAEKKLPENLKENENIKGLLLIKNQIQDFLKNQGVEKIKCLGEKFDPNFQEVVEEVQVQGKDSGIVIEEVQRGYKLHSKVIRPAKVKISK
ncbi:MAG: nucleotide exchange factor GrpE [Candidatus Nealsonbacteria bacterium CG_4_9_14_3_um_filter_35_11]|uniref:Protein GrpE n=2 Tax=Candidatus Nealsoniibacteriota TaxID=1817911 RepID=A0A2M7DBA1_9BACT|nr:MAG: nucleotide exchange factor GrpE [Candidatus Nealsonbacteria bacterium CG11_big_fil_rev_8_21_14_0_20_35_11]PIV45710.1 MAG: nucleotide exchange factor GrpE [Candidatus Nealsonbacteria bacterium CG02_land_8_20_14_3_00_34_20]PIW92793.1 MAG: nucleotide exchange factor GrpE [Candidatus Nealsonbacteria bacterium CG_4_8_14_3_um_filter_34_13]PJA84317.1 MAG: nucleotide exchange factor GrpE [Candidatus Nealsonbacteria bacterium CG_4_9_14_3_um_filter_35_11]